MTQSRYFAGMRVSPIRREELLHAARATLERRGRLTITYLNPDYARRALRDPSLRRDINQCDLVLVDGNGLRLLTPLFGFTVPQRLDTDSVAPWMFGLLAERKARVFLFGCAPGVAASAGDTLVRAFPGIVVAGTEHGFHDVHRGHPGWFSSEDSASIVEQITAAAPDLLIVSLPTPLQQHWVADYGPRLAVPLIMTGGSYLDHLGGADWGAAGSWYPRWADVLRLNWLYRLLREPRRLWRRYSLEYVEFVLLVVRARLVRRARDPAG